MDPHLLDQLRWGALSLLLLVISIGLHEFGHAWVADLRGDLLPRAQGRVTLNPLAHADLLGTWVLPGIMIFVTSVSLNLLSDGIRSAMNVKG